MHGNYAHIEATEIERFHTHWGCGCNGIKTTVFRVVSFVPRKSAVPALGATQRERNNLGEKERKNGRKKESTKEKERDTHTQRERERLFSAPSPTAAESWNPLLHLCAKTDEERKLFQN